MITMAQEPLTTQQQSRVDALLRRLERDIARREAADRAMRRVHARRRQAKRRVEKRRAQVEREREAQIRREDHQWANARITELRVAGAGVTTIQETLFAERDYRITEKGVYRRLKRMRERGKV